MGQAYHGSMWLDRGGNLWLWLDGVGDPSPNAIVTIATCGIESVAGCNRLAAGVAFVAVVELDGVCEIGVRFYTSTWDAMNGPTLAGMLSLGEEVIALLCTITVTPMSFALVKARPLLQTWSD
ncbi:unnamed protein product [Lactuca saligna]|uniref:Uncharacterized protein n=1 Tax=Lactuca saligna TaxID=75948 RepID=A0AA35YRB0_LACSI|nr:unnamed protein product [Lactuca saligna]